jgi:hydrogenase maturation protein HypF
MCETGFAAPVTTSAGRLFDAIAAICGGARATYEGQAAIELEASCDPAERGAYPLPVERGVLDARPAVLAAAADVAAGVRPGVVATRFHHALADAAAAGCAAAAADRGLGTAVLAGGSFANRRLLDRTAERLRAAGLRVLVPERLPPGDGAIAYGQAAVAAAQDMRR